MSTSSTGRSRRGYASISPLGAPRLALDHPLDAGVVPPGVTLDEVTDDPGRLDYLAVTVDAYADSFLPRDAAEAQLASLEAVRGPDVRAVVARREGRPVATAMVVASGVVAGIQLVGTIPAARGRGLGELCTRWAVGAGFELGAGAIVLEASEAASRSTCVWDSSRCHATGGASDRRRSAGLRDRAGCSGRGDITTAPGSDDERERRRPT